CRIRAGFIGDADERSFLKDFIQQINKGLEELGISYSWMQDDITSKTFQELAQINRDSKVQPAANIQDREMRASKSLENPSVREIAWLVRRSGVLLAKELLKQKAEQASEIIRLVDNLLQCELLHQEYVVVCSKTGAHVNRVESREIIEQMAQ